MDLDDLNDVFDNDSDITLDVNLIDGDLDDKVSNKVLKKVIKYFNCMKFSSKRICIYVKLYFDLHFLLMN